MRVRRARPLLGTMVVLGIDADANADTTASPFTYSSPSPSQLSAWFEAGFDAIAQVQRLMSAHDPDSELAQLSRAPSGACLHLHPWTVDLLRLTRVWWHHSGGAFDPCRAAQRLHARGLRPGLAHAASGTLDDLEFLAHGQVRVQRPVMLDLGGIAKGYAVDRAVAAMQAAGATQGLVDAGGDLRAWGATLWPCEIRHAGHGLRSQRLGRLRMLDNSAVATSVAGALNPTFVPRAGLRSWPWRSATVLARDCVTADVLTKWALQSSLLCPQLKAAMRECQASLWRSE